MDQPERYARSLPAHADNVFVLRTELARFVSLHGADADLVWRVELAASEALSNVVAHAYRTTAPGRMAVLAQADAQGFGVAVADTGLGFGPRPDSPGAGFGMSIMRKLATGVSVQGSAARGEGTLVLLRFDRVPEAEAPAVRPRADAAPARAMQAAG